MIQYYIIDLETNGLRPGYHEVIEISVIRGSDRVQLSRNIRCVYPERSSFDALQITGKTLNDLQVGVSKEQAVADINNFMALDKTNAASRCLVGHNIVNFDKKFLHETWSSVGSFFPADLFLDTLSLTKQFIKTHDLSHIDLHKTATGKVSTKLHASLHLTGAKAITAEMHTAKSDTRNTYVLWKKLVEDHKIDYLPYIKNFPHAPKILENIDALDMSDIE